MTNAIGTENSEATIGWEQKDDEVSFIYWSIDKICICVGEALKIAADVFVLKLLGNAVSEKVKPSIDKSIDTSTEKAENLFKTSLQKSSNTCSKSREYCVIS